MRNWTFSGAVLLLAAGSVLAQSPASNLQDLVGVKGASAEGVLRERGYTWVRTSKSGDDAYSYWRHTEGGHCVAVRTSDGRYASLLVSPPSACEKPVQGAPAGKVGHGFETVCGVIAGGKMYRYRCKVENSVQSGRMTRSVLYFPDQKIEMKWLSASEVEVQFEGMNLMRARYATAEGETNFVVDGKTYFYISNKDMALQEVRHFRN